MRTIFVLACLFFSNFVHALGREVSYEEIISQHQNQIIWVATCGAWKSANQAGFYRIVHASIGDQSYIYIQWMKPNSEGDNEVQHMLSVPQINNDHASISLESLNCKVTKAGIKILARSESGHHTKMGVVEIIIFQEFGKYLFKERFQ